MADNLFLEYRIQHALHGCFHILDGLIDNLVQTDIHLLALRNGLGCCIRTDVEADDDCVGRGCQGNIGFVDGAYAAVNHLHHNLLIGELGKTLLYSLHGALHVSLYDNRQFLYITGLNLAEQVIQRQFCLCILYQFALSF